MICRTCHQNITADCILIEDLWKDEKEALKNAICVFCYYDISSWDSNGQLVTKYEATKSSLCINCSRQMPYSGFGNSKGCPWCIQKKGN